MQGSTTDSERDALWMRRALKLAVHAASISEVPVGAIVVDERGEAIGKGYNLREHDADPTAHAEVLALRQAAARRGTWRLDGCTLYVTLEPCPMCAGATVNARLGRVVYGAADPKMGCVDTLHKLCGEPRFNHRVDVTAGVLAHECGDVLRRFFAERRGAEKPPKPGPAA